MSLSDKEIMEELESWKGFGDALKAEDRELFTEMLRECYESVPSMHAKASPFSARPCSSASSSSSTRGSPAWPRR